MEAYTTEEQQWEAIKKWFKKYGNRLSWVLVIILAFIAGTNYWLHHKEVVRERASDSYMDLLESVGKGDETSVTNKAKALLDEYRQTPYATYAAFILANEAAKTNDINETKKHLIWIMKHGKSKEFQAIARVRLMRLLLDQEITPEILKEADSLYDEKAASGFLTLLAELKGDILLMQKDVAGARTYYEKAYKAAPEEGMHSLLLKMKMEALGIKTS